MKQLSTVAVKIPIFLPSVANLREHWTKKHKRQKAHEKALRLCIGSHTIAQLVGIGLPISVALTRWSTRDLDADNLISAFKHIRDCVADILIPGLAKGRADSDPRITWTYLQRKSKEKFVEIIFWKEDTYERL